MLYLAEVLRKARVIGGGRAEFRLLACQRSEQSWSAVSGDDVIPAPDDVHYNAGTLVMVELTASRQVQRHQEASRQLVSLLQNFSRLQEKFKTQEEEIEQWKQSLTYQSQELNRREMEMEARQEQLQQLDEDLERLEQQRQEIEATREEANRLKEEFERKSQELEGAWAHLHGEMNRLEEQRSSLQTALDGEQAQQLQDLVNRLTGAVPPAEVREQLNFSFAILAQQQETLNYHWHNLEQQRASAQQLQAEVDRQAEEIHSRWQAWHQAQVGVEQAQADLKAQQTAQAIKQDYAQLLAAQVKAQESVYQQVNQLSDTTGFRGSSKVDLDALERMPIDQLQGLVQDLHRDLEKSSRFVNDQEEELTSQQQAIDDLKARIQQASEYDRLNLEAELADEQDRYQMLNQTLVGQRRNLQERQGVVKLHQTVLNRRQGLPAPELPTANIDLDPVLTQIEALKQQQTQALHALETELRQLQVAIDQAQQNAAQQSSSQAAQLIDLKQFEQSWQSQKATAAELWGKVNTYQETLQPMQDSVNAMRENLEAIANQLNDFQASSDDQRQAATELQQKLRQLSGSQTPEFVVS